MRKIGKVWSRYTRMLLPSFFFFLRGCITILNKSSRHGASYLLSERWINVLYDESPASEKYQIYGRVACVNAPTPFIAP